MKVHASSQGPRTAACGPRFVLVSCHWLALLGSSAALLPNCPSACGWPNYHHKLPLPCAYLWGDGAAIGGQSQLKILQGKKKKTTGRCPWWMYLQKVLHRILANQIKQHNKGNIPWLSGSYGWVERMVQHMQISAIYHINRMKEKNQDHLNRCIKSIWQIQHPSMIKMQQIGDRRNIF